MKFSTSNFKHTRTKREHRVWGFEIAKKDNGNKSRLFVWGFHKNALKAHDDGRVTCNLHMQHRHVDDTKESRKIHHFLAYDFSFHFWEAAKIEL